MKKNIPMATAAIATLAMVLASITAVYYGNKRPFIPQQQSWLGQHMTTNPCSSQLPTAVGKDQTEIYACTTPEGDNVTYGIGRSMNNVILFESQQLADKRRYEHLDKMRLAGKFKTTCKGVDTLGDMIWKGGKAYVVHCGIMDDLVPNPAGLWFPDYVGLNTDYGQRVSERAANIIKENKPPPSKDRRGEGRLE